ncbi:MAG: VOC family protein [Verrucomicrobia bacterium]|nr:VOC family protein [Verrucomicrobiota bacterium]
MKPNLAEFTEQFGLILFVEKFHECERFYAETIGLQILYRKESLTAFEFGNGYLMLETGSSETRNAARPFVIRLNVRDLMRATKYVEDQGVDVVTHHFDWGSIAVFTDPEGNRCELKTSPTR